MLKNYTNIPCQNGRSFSDLLADYNFDIYQDEQHKFSHKMGTGCWSIKTFGIHVSKFT